MREPKEERGVAAAVLIADDDVNAQIILETVLRLRGLRVLLAADGAEACEIARREHVAVVLLELNLPGMNGFEVLRRLRGRFGAPHLPNQPRVIVVTGRAEPEVERFVLRLGAHAFLRKPVDPGQLIEGIEGLARGA